MSELDLNCDKCGKPSVILRLSPQGTWWCEDCIEKASKPEDRKNE